MGFLAPWFFVALAGIGLPVYIHLLRRHTSTPRPVSSLMFFEQGTQSSLRHRRLRYYLLFTLRALLILLLALAFTNPFLRHASPLPSDKLLLIVVDNSFSMNAGTRLDEAKRGALAVLTSRNNSQRAQVMVLGSQLQILTQPIQDAGALRAAVEGIRPGDSRGNFGELCRGIGAMAEIVHTPVELHLFSDMQSSNMPANFADMVMPGNVSLVLHPIDASIAPNWTVESVQAPDRLVDPKKVRVLAVIAGHQTPAATRLVSLVVNGKTIATQKVAVPKDGRATAAFESLDVPFGKSRCAVRIDAADQFPADDANNFSVTRADPERVLFIHQATDVRSPLYFGDALAAVAQSSFVLQSITPDQAADVDPSKYAFTVLSDVTFIPSILEHSLLANIQNGGNVLIATGPSNSHHEHIPVFGGNVLEPKFYAREGGSDTIGQIDTSHPVTNASGPWKDVKFFYAATVEAKGSRIVATLADGTPLLLDKQIGQGHALLFASGLDNLSNDLPLHPEFVPFVDQSARYLSGMERLTGARVVDSFVELRSPSQAVAMQAANQMPTIDIIAPDGTRPLSLEEAAATQTFQLAHAGFYQIRFANDRDALIAVNPDPRESDLTPIPDDVLKLWSGSPEPHQAISGKSAPIDTNSIFRLWWWIMLLLFLVALAESVIAGRHLDTLREQI